MSSALANLRCVVTGASSGIGAATAALLAERGAWVVGFARRFDDDGATPGAEPGRVHPARLDITDEAAVLARFAEIGDIDVLVNAAGVGAFGPTAEFEVARVRAMLDVSIVGTFLCCKQALRTMLPRRTGHIINVGSIAAVRPLQNCGPYGAAKAGQRALLQTLAEEVRGQGVAVSSLLVGAVDTPIWDDRPGFDRAQMLQPDQVAEVIADITCRRGVGIEEMTIVPPGGVLRSTVAELAR